MYPIADFGSWIVRFNEFAGQMETASLNVFTLVLFTALPIILFTAFSFMMIKVLIHATEKVVSMVVYSVLSIIPALAVLNVCIKDGHNICTAEQLNATVGEIVSFLNSTLNR